MNHREPTSVLRVLPAVALALCLAPAAASADEESCPIPIDDVKAAIDSFATKAGDQEKGAEKDLEKQTSSKYADKFLDAFEKLNKNADDATELVTYFYDLSGSKYSGQMDKGKTQSGLPPKVTITMENAVELAEWAADEDGTKLELAQLRCSQNTEDAALAAALEQLDGGTVDKFQDAKKKVCKLVQIVADLQKKKEQLDEIRTEGYPIFHLEKKDKKNFGGKERTIQIRVDLRMYPEYPGGADQDFLLGQIEGINLAYNSYFKWSDNNWTTLNLYEYLIGEGKDEGEVCFPKIKLSSSVKVATCFKFLDVTDEYIKLRVRGKYWYNDDSGTVKLVETKIPAPFGYLADVSDMKESGMENLQDMLVDRIADMLGPYGDMIEQAQEWKESCGT